MTTIHRQLKIGETWRRKRKLHRDDGPALISTWKDKRGELYSIDHEWYKDGKRHRIDGPAVVQHNSRMDRDSFRRGHIAYYLEDVEVNKAYIDALAVVRRFRNKVPSLRVTSSRWYRLYELTKTRAFCEWYYHPDNIGGVIQKRRINAFLTTLDDAMCVEAK
jgi:hypothetical protein